MKKNYFKFLLISAMMLMTGVSFTSCGDQSDNPVDDPTEVEDPVIKETKKGAKITINNLSDIPGFLGQLSALVAEKNGGKFVLDVASYAPIEVTEGDNVLVIPNVAGSNLVINFNSELISDGTALTMKLDDKASSRAMLDDNDTVYDKKVALNLKNTDTDLILDVPGVTVTVSSLNSIQVLNGLSIVKKGASINTYVYAPKRNDVFLVNGGTESVGVYWTDDETGEPDGRYGSFPVVRSAEDTEWQYFFKNIKVVKGEADYAGINIWEEDRKLDKLTIAEGATVVLRNSLIKEIAGEGSGATVMGDNTWWINYEEKTFDTQLGLFPVEKASNITFEPLIEGDYKQGKLLYSTIFDVPAEIENCTFKYSRVIFRNPQSTSGTVKGCKFMGTDTEKSIEITVPYQTEEITGFKFSFDKCEFPKDCMFHNSINTSKPILDEKGNPVFKDIYRWWVFTDEGMVDWSQWPGSETLDGVPADKQEIGKTESGWTNEEGKSKNGYSTGYWIERQQQYEEVEFKDYYIYISFTDCKIDGAALNSSNINIGNTWMPYGAYLRYEFDGKTYRAIQMYDPEKQQSTWMLIEA